MNQYLFLLHEKPADAVAVSAAEAKETVARYQAWAADLAQRGLLSGGEKLSDNGGQHVSLRSGQPSGQVLVSDGPYAEAHDVIGGYFVVKAESDASALALAQTCPHLKGPQWIEIRRIDAL
jgi:hypothetical protein